VRHVVYRPDADDPSPDVVLTETGHMLETVNTERDWDDLDKGRKDVEKHGRKLKKDEEPRELTRHEKEGEDKEREKKRKKPKMRKRRGN